MPMNGKKKGEMAYFLSKTKIEYGLSSNNNETEQTWFSKSQM